MKYPCFKSITYKWERLNLSITCLYPIEGTFERPMILAEMNGINMELNLD
jgi:hypothetical protein